MIYRVILSVGYNKAWFDFSSLEEAGDFAKAVLIHQSPNEDTTKRDSIRIEVFDPSIKDAEEDEDNE